MTELPIYEISESFAEGLRDHKRFVLEAPTGSGKSTQIPQMILDQGFAGEGQIIVLQPRRVAARMLAKRIAQERNGKLGDEVGYQIRFDNISGKQTRIKFITEGLLLRWMLENPDLPGISTLLFDEFHERHIYGDVCLALALRLQERRPDLLIGVMSATLESNSLVEYMNPCLFFKAQGRMYPVEIAYSAAASRVADKEIWDKAAYHFNQLAKEYPEGDFLIFMPGSFEINRTIQAIEKQTMAKHFAILPLYGDLPPERQDRALGKWEKRKVVVATNVAETSLTIDGVRFVIDSGLARIPIFDQQRGINTVLVQNISRASADQRTGRAGRTQAGYCLRLWGEREHQFRQERISPELHRIDLSEIVLTLKAGGITDLSEIVWFEAPEEKALLRATNFLTTLGALDHGLGKITTMGKQMVGFPLHPRYSRMLIEAHNRNCLNAVAWMAACSQVKSFLLPIKDKRQREKREDLLFDEFSSRSDFFLLMRAWQLAKEKHFDMAFCRQWGIHATSARQVETIARQFLRLAESQGLSPGSAEWDPTDVQKCLLLGFSDQLAHRMNPGTLRCALVHGRTGEIRRESMARNTSFFVSAEIEERNMKGQVVVFLGTNTSIEPEWLEELFPNDFSEKQRVEYDSRQRRVTSVKEQLFRDLVLSSSEDDNPPLDQAARLLAEEVIAGNIKLKQWSQPVETWINRVNFLAIHFPEYGFNPIRQEDRLLILEQFCYSCTKAKELTNRDPWSTLRDWLTSEQLNCMDTFAPERYSLPNGRSPKLRYEAEGKVVLPVVLQQLYDIHTQPALANGKVPLLLEILAPNMRPVQLTNDIASFWETSYPDIKKQLKGRYPKHEWR